VPSHVRDFRYARYAMEGAECSGSDGHRFSYLMVEQSPSTTNPRAITKIVCRGAYSA
jgi:hypothetical protein